MAKAFLVSALRSGEGKTLVTLGLLRYFRNKGFKVQPFKVGPDYIDPKWHKLSAGRYSYNLDLFSMGEEKLKSLFYYHSRSADYALVEGVMGLFDGKFSTFRVAKILKIPLLIVLDTFGIGETLRYLIKGVAETLKRAELSFSFFLNRVSSEKHLLRLERALKGYPISGFLFRKPDYELPSRHLGLFLPQEIEKVEELLSQLALDLEKTLDLSFLNQEKRIPQKVSLPSFLPQISFKKLGVALDTAFNFYYQHLLDELSQKVELKFFNTLEDPHLPSEIEGLYFGGGYPELLAEQLSLNTTLMKEIKDFAYSGSFIYAECGGLIYLSQRVNWNGKTYPLVGLFPFEIRRKGLSLGYRKVKLKEVHPFFGEKVSFLAHEFHYTGIKKLEIDYEIKKIYKVKTLEGKSFDEGYSFQKVLASYCHFLAKT